MECYRPDVVEAEELTTEVVAPEVELVETEEVFTAPPETISSPVKRRSKVSKNSYISSWGLLIIASL